MATAIDSATSGLPAYEAPDPFAPVGSSTLDRQDFMKLFLAQMQYQDPMEPMNNYEVAAQLAQFSNMEATMGMADNMEKLLEFQTSQNNLQLLTLMDKGVQGFGNTMGVVGGVSTPTQFTLYDAADFCVVEIYDAAGKLADTINVGYAAAGSHDLAWDATMPNGDKVPDGAYTYRVDALSPAGQQVEVEYRTTGKVTGLEFDSGTATVSVDKYIQMNVSDILSVN